MNKLFMKVIGIYSMFMTNGLFAQESGEVASGREQGIWHTVVMIGIALVFFYIILWRPEQKKRRAMDQRRNGLDKGDKVTAMGIIGTVLRVQDDTIILKMYDGAKIEVLKAAITDVQHSSEDGSRKDES